MAGIVDCLSGHELSCFHERTDDELVDSAALLLTVLREMKRDVLPKGAFVLTAAHGDEIVEAIRRGVATARMAVTCRWRAQVIPFAYAHALDSLRPGLARRAPYPDQI